MTTEQRRKEFEEWALSNTCLNLDLDMDLHEGDNHYWDFSTYAAWEAWQAAVQKEQDEYCPHSDPLHPHGIRFREDSPTPRTDEVNLDNLPLEDALRFADENNTTGGLLIMAALKTLEVGCRELTAVTKEHDIVVLELRRVDNQLTAVTEQRDRLAEELKETKKHLKDANRGAEINAHALRINADKLTTAREEIKELDEELHTHVTRLSNSLTAVTEQRDEARKLAERYRYLSCDSQEEADATLLPWENNQPTEP